MRLPSVLVLFVVFITHAPAAWSAPSCLELFKAEEDGHAIHSLIEPWLHNTPYGAVVVQPAATEIDHTELINGVWGSVNGLRLRADDLLMRQEGAGSLSRVHTVRIKHTHPQAKTLFDRAVVHKFSSDDNFSDALMRERLDADPMKRHIHFESDILYLDPKNELRVKRRVMKSHQD